MHGLRASVIIPAYNSSEYIMNAIRSAQKQTLDNIEIIVVDDCSTDCTAKLVEAASSLDRRIKLILLPCNRGAGAARNAGVNCASGDWIVMLDSDDLMAAGRTERLVQAAEIDGLDIACDSLLMLDRSKRVHSKIVTHKSAKDSIYIGLSDYISGNSLGFKNSDLGFLQPILKRDTLVALSVHYNENLSIAEDFDFIARLLARGCRMKIYPWVGYFYIRRKQSLSYRWNRKALEQIRSANEYLKYFISSEDSKTLRILDKRTKNIEREIKFCDLVNHIKQSNFLSAMTTAVSSPSAVLMLTRVLRGRMTRRSVQNGNAPTDCRSSKKNSLP